MTPEAQILSLCKLPGGHIDTYSDGRISVTYRSQRRDFPPLRKTISVPDYVAVEVWIKAQDAPAVRDCLGYERWSPASCIRCGYEPGECTCPGGYAAPEHPVETEIAKYFEEPQG